MSALSVITQLQEAVEEMEKADEEVKVLISLAKEAGVDTVEVENEARRNRQKIKDWKNSVIATKAKIKD